MKKCRKVFKTALSILLVVIFAFSGVTSAASAEGTSVKEWKTADELIEQLGFLNGIQMPYTFDSSTGNDIGYSQVWSTDSAFDIEKWKEFFTNSKAMGFDICKTWLTYQMGGIAFDADFRVVGTTTDYLQNLEKIFKLAEEQGMYLCITLMSHYETMFNSQATSFKYEQLSRFIHNKKFRELYIQNWLIPVLKLSAKYECVIMADVYCEPEADAGLWNLTRGTNWEKMREYITEVNKVVKEYNPRLKTYCSATTDPTMLGDRYSELGLDFYGYDYYSKEGNAHDPSELFLDAPLIYGEIGIQGGLATEEYATNAYSNILTSCYENGIKAAFYWSYMPGAGHVYNITDYNGTGRLRSSSLAIRSWAWDRENNLAGTPDALDMPVMMYSTAAYIRWYGSRGASRLTLQRSTDKQTWKDIVSFNPDTTTEYEFSALMYQYNDDTAEVSVPYYYRVIAENGDGEKKISDPTFAITRQREICDDSENLIIGGGDFDNFEENISDDPTKGWVKKESTKAVVIKNGVEGDTTYSGSASLYKPAYMYQDITVKPNTRYTFTFHYKYNNKLGLWYQFFGVATRWPADKFYDSYHYYGDLMKPIQIDLTLRNGEWHRYTTTFNSGDATKVRVMFDSYYGIEDVDWYLDGVYLFENPAE